MKRLADRGHQVGVQIVDNEVSADFKNKYSGRLGRHLPTGATQRTPKKYI